MTPKAFATILGALMLAGVLLWWRAQTPDHAIGLPSPEVNSPLDALVSSPVVTDEQRTPREQAVLEPSRSGEGANPPPTGTVQILDTSREPIADARVYRLFADRPAELVGVTSKDGRLQIQLEPASDHICASAAGYSRGRCIAPERQGEEVCIFLESEGVLAGLVHRDGVPAGGAEVFAWESAHPAIPSRLSERALRGDPDVAWATTNEEGKFRIDGLRSSLSYSVIAVKSGAFGSMRARTIRPPNDNIVIQLQAVYANRLCLVDGAGSPAVMPARYSSDRALVMEATFSEPEVEFVSPGLERLLLGTSASAGPGTLAHTFFVTCSNCGPSVGPFEASIQLPGYEPRSLEVDAYPIMDSEIHQQVVQLNQVGGPRGAIRVRLRSGLSASEVRTEFGGFLFVLVGQSYGPLNFALPDAREDCLLSDIPTGSYTWYLTSTALPGFKQAGGNPFEPIEVGASERLVEIDISKLGSIDIQIQSGDSMPYEGPCRIRLLSFDDPKPNRAKTGMLIFESGPYSIHGVPAGRYSVNVAAPAAHEVGGGTTRFDLLQGEVRTLGFKLD